MNSPSRAETDPSGPVVRLADTVDASQLDLGDLSDIFNPFMRHFVEVARRGTGEVWVSQRNRRVDGILLYNRTEKVGSIFTRDPNVAEQLYGLKDGVSVFSDFPLGAKSDTYQVYAANLILGPGPHRFRHVVRIARGHEQAEVSRMLNEMYGPIDTGWLSGASPPGETCFVVDVGGRLVGAGWVTIVGDQGRLHSLSVRPHYRRAGIGTDLWHARTEWAARRGVRRVISEIWEQNVPSIAIAKAGGMEPVGRIFLSHRPGPPLGSGDRRPAVGTDLVGHVD